MAESKLLELPYERIAMAGGEMPKGLEYPDQILFLELRLLYDSYKRKLIDRESATREKWNFCEPTKHTRSLTRWARNGLTKLSGRN